MLVSAVDGTCNVSHFQVRFYLKGNIKIACLFTFVGRTNHKTLFSCDCY